ncbi:D-alanyl-D-alanine carboxypeptidase/D-alanyl-D-alanine endopeptidase [Calidifontibacter terrae]
MKRVLTATAVALLAVGAYGTLDVYDKVPGVLTLAGADATPVPLPDQTTPAPSVAAPAAPAAQPLPAAPAGTPITAAQVSAALAGPLASKNLPPKVSMVVRDATTGATLFDQGGATVVEPASVTKVLSAYVVANTLSLDKPLTTKVVGNGDHIVLVAGGDTLLNPGKGDPNQIVGHAGVADLAQSVAAALKKQGRSTVTLDLDLSYAPGPFGVSSWSPTYLSQGFSARIAQLGLSTQRSEPPKAAAADPNKSVQQALITQLKSYGVAATAGSEVTAPTTAPVLGAVQSAPLIDVLGQAMRDSDNAMIESLTRQAAFTKGVAGDDKSVPAFVISTLKEHGFDTTGLKLADVCGLSDGTTFTAALLADVVTAGTSGKNPNMANVLSHESVAGWNGTLDDRFLTASSNIAAGEVRAKTGSLPGVSSLAGTVTTRSGRLLSFAIITNGTFPGGVWGTRNAIDNAVAALTKL